MVTQPQTAQVEPHAYQGHETARTLNPPAQRWRASRRGAARRGRAQPVRPDGPDASPLAASGLAPGEGYLSDAVNRSHAPALNSSVPLSRFVVSRTRTVPRSEAVSTQFPPLSEKLDLRQREPSSSIPHLPF